MLKCLNSSVLAAVVILCGAALATPAQAQTIRRVKPATPAGNDGQSWATAYDDLWTCLEAIAVAVPQPPDGWQIWVAEGTYVPNPNGGTTVNATFTLRNNVRVFGGFGGDEANLVERDLSQHVTVLDGFIPDPVPAECGAPGSGSCVVAHGGHPENCDDGTGTAGCEDPGCCSLVCATFP